MIFLGDCFPVNTFWTGRVHVWTVRVGLGFVCSSCPVLHSGTAFGGSSQWLVSFDGFCARSQLIVAIVFSTLLRSTGTFAIFTRSCVALCPFMLFGALSVTVSSTIL